MIHFALIKQIILMRIKREVMTALVLVVLVNAYSLHLLELKLLKQIELAKNHNVDLISQRLAEIEKIKDDLRGSKKKGKKKI